MTIFSLATTFCFPVLTALSSLLGPSFTVDPTQLPRTAEDRPLLIMFEDTHQFGGQVSVDRRNLFAGGIYEVCQVDTSNAYGRQLASKYGVTKFPCAVITNATGDIVYRGSELLKPRRMPAAGADELQVTDAETSQADSSLSDHQLVEREPFAPATLGEAQELVSSSNKMLAVFVTTPACHYCLKMKRDSLHAPEVESAVRDQFISARIEADTCPDFVAQHGVRLFPTVLILTSQGQLIDRIEGYASAGQLASRLRHASTTWVSQR